MERGGATETHILDGMECDEIDTIHSILRTADQQPVQLSFNAASQLSSWGGTASHAPIHLDGVVDLHQHRFPLLAQHAAHCKQTQHRVRKSRQKIKKDHFFFLVGV